MLGWRSLRRMPISSSRFFTTLGVRELLRMAFNATSCPVSSCTAWYTWAKLPAPRSLVTVYLPTLVAVLPPSNMAPAIALVNATGVVPVKRHRNGVPCAGLRVAVQ